MVRFASLFNFTEQGIRKYAETVSRADAFIKEAQKSGVKVTAMYWLVGAHDGLVVMEAPDEQTATATLLKLGSLGNVRTQTMRAYDRAEMEPIVAKAR
ncbi:MAG TPA: GYD domain-containing protein [Tepidisphaeraceae bacterium]|jgi:uncharacterized protein with GYD domain|nr:GYD domain-containing protein [Tepidisphaeraceae bacterium]